jgi:hypothetical protein
MATTSDQLDQSKRGLQDDHDPSDLGQRTNDKSHGANKQGANKHGAKSQLGEKADPNNERPEQ